MKYDINKADSQLYDISQRIKSLRKQKKLTQKRLGELIGVTHTTISSYENDKGFPSPEVLVRLSSVLGVTNDQLLGVTEIPHQPSSDDIINIENLSDKHKAVLKKFVKDWIDLEQK